MVSVEVAARGDGGDGGVVVSFGECGDCEVGDGGGGRVGVVGGPGAAEGGFVSHDECGGGVVGFCEEGPFCSREGVGGGVVGGGGEECM